MSLVYLRVYYLLLTFLVLVKATSFSFRPSAGILYIFIFIVTMCCTFFCIYNPNKIARCLVAVFINILIGYHFHYENYYHSSHIWMFSSLLMCFFKKNKKFNDKNNQLVFSLINIYIFGSYFSSGLWKLRNMDSFSYSFLEKSILNHYAYAMAEGQHIAFLVKSLITEYSSIMVVGYLFVIIFQLTSFLPIINPKLRSLWALGAILFHVSCALTLGIRFMETVLAILFLVILSELLARDSTKENLNINNT